MEPINKQRLGLRKEVREVFNPGDLVRIGIEVDSDCYVHLIDINPEGKVMPIVHGERRDNFVRAGKAHFVPEAGGELFVEDTSGIDTILAIATVKLTNLFPEWQGTTEVFEELEAYPLTLRDLARAATYLSCMPKSQWTTASCQFEVRSYSPFVKEG